MSIYYLILLNSTLLKIWNKNIYVKVVHKLLNIKKYIPDGAFDDDTQKFITFSTPLDVPIRGYTRICKI